jgi:hypothetical protein
MSRYPAGSGYAGGGDGGGGGGAAPQPALSLAAPEGAQLRCFTLGLDALSDREQVEGVGEGEDCCGDPVLGGVGVEVGHQAAVDLDDGGGGVPQGAQRGVPGAEVVDGDADTGAAQGVEGEQGLRVLGEHLGFGDLQDHVGGRGGVAVQAGQHVGGEVG